MDLVGIEFTSILSEIIFYLVLLLLVFVIVWLIRRVRQSDGLLSVVRRDNSMLRNEIANVTGWTVDGRLPEDWKKKLQTGHAAAGSSGLTNIGRLEDAVLPVAHQALLAIDPPYFASNDSDDSIEDAHLRVANLFERLALREIDPHPALVNGDFDKLFCMWRRLEAYFPNDTETFMYSFAANAALDLLKRQGIQIIAPRPLSVVSADICRLTTDDVEELREILPIRAAALTASANLASLQDEDEFVIDCQSPGWKSADGQETPKILILDKSW